ncbi:MAG: hypothetical protein ACYC1K_01945 [Minisyncoccota bacterium]
MTSNWKMPPRAKVYEALSALADNRVLLTSESTAEVTSSSGDKKYQVEWKEDGKKISSNDNASFYQGYIGYPIIAVLIKIGRIPYRPEIAAHLAGVPWKKLNTKHKRNYDKAIEEVLGALDGGTAARTEIEADVDAIFALLPTLELEKAGVWRSPPLGR